jgi:hypothetical protein
MRVSTSVVSDRPLCQEVWILAPLSSAHRDRAIAALCEKLNAADVYFPGTRLRLRYAVASNVMPDADRTN